MRNQEQKLAEAELQMDGCRTKRDEKHWQNSRRKSDPGIGGTDPDCEDER